MGTFYTILEKGNVQSVKQRLEHFYSRVRPDTHNDTAVKSRKFNNYHDFSTIRTKTVDVMDVSNRCV